jgi:hypothetical protein
MPILMTDMNWFIMLVLWGWCWDGGHNRPHHSQKLKVEVEYHWHVDERVLPWSAEYSCYSSRHASSVFSQHPVPNKFIATIVHMWHQCKGFPSSYTDSEIESELNDWWLRTLSMPRSFSPIFLKHTSCFQTNAQPHTSQSYAMDTSDFGVFKCASKSSES